ARTGPGWYRRVRWVGWPGGLDASSAAHVTPGGMPGCLGFGYVAVVSMFLGFRTPFGGWHRHLVGNGMARIGMARIGPTQLVAPVLIPPRAAARPGQCLREACSR
ncbi:MAG TPA: hypothetical protein VFX70_20590, partial [Mycobacteriales bacterium]|nr:hypothetical protein [Mycobacteriales bacterium]